MTEIGGTKYARKRLLGLYFFFLLFFFFKYYLTVIKHFRFLILKPNFMPAKPIMVRHNRCPVQELRAVLSANMLIINATFSIVLTKNKSIFDALARLL